MALLNINGVDMKTPKKFQVSISDIDGAVKRKLEIEFPPLTQDEISTLLNAVYNVFFEVTFLDAKDGFITLTMYVGDRTSPILIYGDGSNILWDGLKMNFIEQ
jgi:hypothetical protein